MSIIQPGEKLAEFFRSLYPFPGEGSPVSKIDYDLMEDDEYSRLVYESQIHYLVRRFIKSVRHIYENNINKGDSVYHKIKIRQYIQRNTRYDSSEVNELVTLLLECIRSAEASGNGNLNRTKSKAKREDANCAFCGKSMTFAKNVSKEQRHEQVTADHVWPKSLGGVHSMENMRAVCHKCNSRKGDYLGYYDYHYEYMCSKAPGRGKFKKERGYEWKLAVLARSNFECYVCGASAEKIGELIIARKESSDYWHFLNLAAFCPRHLP